jgi:hypothetical protein
MVARCTRKWLAVQFQTALAQIARLQVHLKGGKSDDSLSA